MSSGELEEEKTEAEGSKFASDIKVVSAKYYLGSINFVNFYASLRKTFEHSRTVGKSNKNSTLAVRLLVL